jgi:hypothetical protein
VNRLAVVFLLTSALVLRRWAPRIRHLALASVTLALVVLPFIVVLSIARGHPTAGDSAMLNYVWVIDGAPTVHWQGGPDDTGQPIHRSEQLLERPTIFAFDSPFPVTYAAWYAPEYWFSGATPHFVLGGQIRAVHDALRAYASLAVDLAVVWVALALLLSRRAGPWRASALLLLAPAVAALGMYALVLVEPRYVAPFVVLLVLGLLMLVQRPKGSWSTALATPINVAVVAVLVLQTAWTMSGAARSAASQTLQGRVFAPDDQARVAYALRSAGIGAFDAVASGDRALDDIWARLARVRIVAEVSDRDGGAILAGDPAARAETQRLLVGENVRAVVAPGWPALTGDPGWRPIDGTDYFYYLVADRS